MVLGRHCGIGQSQVDGLGENEFDGVVAVPLYSCTVVSRPSIQLRPWQRCLLLQTQDGTGPLLRFHGIISVC